MSSYNQPKYVEQAIKSVLNQSFQDFELIIIDGGSNIETQTILKSYGSHPQVTLTIEKDKGMYHARNKGLLKAKGDIIGFLNTDDYYEINALEIIDEQVRNNPNYDIFYGLNLAVYENGELKRIYGNEDVTISERVSKNVAIPDQSTFFKKKMFSHLGMYNTSYKIVSDWDFWQRAIVLGYRFKKIEKHISNYRHYSEALTFNPKFEKLRYKEKKRLYRNYNSQTYSKFEFNLSLRKFIILPIKKVRLFSNIYYSIFKK